MESNPSSDDETDVVLPPNTRLKNAKTGLYQTTFKRGGKQYCKTGKDLSALVKWKREIDDRLDAEGVPPTRVQTKAEIQSSTPGVKWVAKCKTNPWYGQYKDRLTGKMLSTSCFAKEEDAVAAIKTLREETDARFETEIQKRYETAVLESLNLAGLPRAPAKAVDARKGIVYWHIHKKSGFLPYRVVRSGGHYEIACADCHQTAHSSAIGQKRTHCIQHGGGGAKRCVHDRPKTACRECNPNIRNCVNNCWTCGTVLAPKRRRTKGGNGLCSACETHQKDEANSNGSAPPEKSERWEDFVLDKLIPKVVDAKTSMPFPYEMRDDMRHMLGSNGKRRRGECDTTKQRRPDLLYLVREPTRSRIVAALKIGVDEHSHDGYDPECESGKIDDQFQALQQLAAKEGAATGAVARFDAQMIYCTFLKFNPNACDVKPPVKLDDRINVLAKRCSDFLNTPASEFQRRSEAGEADVPHVECLFYHSVQGKPILDHFNKHSKGAWDWNGNRYS